MFVQGFILIGLLVKERVHIYIHIIIVRDILRITGIFILFISIIVK